MEYQLSVTIMNYSVVCQNDCKNVSKYPVTTTFIGTGYVFLSIPILRFLPGIMNFQRFCWRLQFHILARVPEQNRMDTKNNCYWSCGIKRSILNMLESSVFIFCLVLEVTGLRKLWILQRVLESSHHKVVIAWWVIWIIILGQIIKSCWDENDNVLWCFWLKVMQKISQNSCAYCFLIFLIVYWESASSFTGKKLESRELVTIKLFTKLCT